MRNAARWLKQALHVDAANVEVPSMYVCMYVCMYR
jgi:hypothetical protein